MKVPRGWFSKKRRQRKKSRKKYGGVETFKELLKQKSLFGTAILKVGKGVWQNTTVVDLNEFYKLEYHTE